MSWWSDFFGTAVTGVAPLIGVYLGAQLQKGAKAEERSERKKELLRQKAEAIYEEMDQVLIRAREAQFLARQPQVGGSGLGLHESFANTSRLRALSLMYFPGSRPIWEKYALAVAPLANALEMPDDPAEDATEEQLEEMIATVREMRGQFAEAMTDTAHATIIELRSFLDSEVTKLL